MTEPTALARFTDELTSLAQDALSTFDKDSRDEATRRFLVSFNQSATSAKNAAAYYAVMGTQAGRKSMAHAVYFCAISNLYPGGPLPDLYFIPRKDRDGNWTINPMPSFRGLKRYVERSSGARLDVHLVYECDVFDTWTDDKGRHVMHRPDVFASETDRNLDTMRGGFVLAHMPVGPPAVVFMSKDEILKRRGTSDSYRAHLSKGWQSPWVDWPLEMAHKTVLRYAVDRGIVPVDMSPAVALLLDADNADTILDAPSEPVERRVVASSNEALRAVLLPETDAGEAEQEPQEGAEPWGEPPA